MARIVHVSDYESLGGAEVVFRNTVQVSRELGHRSEVALAQPDGVRAGRGGRTPLSYVWSRRNFLRFTALLHEVDPDIVHLQNFYHLWSPSVLAAIARYRQDSGRLKVVMTAHDFHLVCPNSALVSYRGHDLRMAGPTTWPRLICERYDRRSHAHSMLKKIQYALAYMVCRYQRQIDLILSPSEYLADMFERRGITIPIEVVRNPITPPSSVAGMPRSGVVYFGRLTAEKGVVAAAEELAAAGVGLDIYGDGEAREQLVELSRRYDNIGVHQALRHDRMMSELARFSVMIMPGLAAENAPLSVIEAAAQGVKVVAVKGSGAAEMARLTAVATVYNPYRPGELVRCVREALANPAVNRPLDPQLFSHAAFRRSLASVYDRLSR